MPQPLVKPRKPQVIPFPSRSIGAQPITWDDCSDLFFADCRRRNLSPETINGIYSWVLRGERIRQFRLDHGIDRIDQLSGDALRTFEEELVESGLAPRSVSIFHRTLKTFANFCVERGFLKDESALRVNGPRLPQDHPVGFTADEERRLLAAAERQHPRDRVILEFMMRTGLRLGEVTRLTVDDIVEAPEGWFVRVRQGKGRKDRIVPLDSPQHSVSRIPRHYIMRIRPQDTLQRGLWLTHKKIANDDYAPMTVNGIGIVFKKLTARTGIQVHPHRCRHHFATRSLAAGLNPLALQRALGHTTMAMTSRYVSASEADLLDAWRHRRD